MSSDLEKDINISDIADIKSNRLTINKNLFFIVLFLFTVFLIIIR